MVQVWFEGRGWKGACSSFCQTSARRGLGKSWWAAVWGGCQCSFKDAMVGAWCQKKTILMDLVAGGTSAIPNPGKLTLNNAKRQRAFYNTFISTYSLTSGTPQKPNGCGNTDLFVIVTVRLTDSNTVQKPKSMSCTLNSISDDVTVALTAKGTGRVWR